MPTNRLSLRVGWLMWMTVALVIAPASELVAENEASAATPGQRVSQGLLVLYDFADHKAALVKDVSGAGKPVHLRISKPSLVRRQPGTLEVRGKVLIKSAAPADRVVRAIRRSGAITLEAWLETAELNQQGPARIVTISKTATARNITLGQDGDRFDVRLRTTKTSGNGLPSFPSKPNSVKRKLTHVVYTRERSGTSKLYINGRRQLTREVPGSLTNWEEFHLGLANEMYHGRPWRGTFHLVAIYGRGLSEAEVSRNYDAGAGGETRALARRVIDPRARHFELEIAPLLANHCLECHDSATRGGELDLSKKVAAFQGGESGELLVSGKSAESLLWDYIESDEMPKDRPPLSEREKKTIREWIDAGAIWSLDAIDAAVYAHNSRDGQQWLRRLTVAEYIETVRHAVGVDIAQEARRLLPADLRADGFTNTAYNLNVDLKHIDAYRQLAEIIVARLDVMEFTRGFTKKLKFTDKDMGSLISGMGKWLLRGPLSEQEVISFRGISTSVVANGGDFPEAIGLMIEAMLQSPRFIYRIEEQRGDGSPTPVDEYELASRLSYTLWGGPPDKQLMQAAENGDLFSPEQCRRQVERMLDDPRSIQHSKWFLSEWLNLPRLANLAPSADKFPNWSPSLAEDMRAETLAFFEDVVWRQGRPLAELMNAQTTFVTPRLAAHYGLPPLQGSEERLQQVDLNKVPSRGGLLTHGSVLTVGGDEASMVTRGLFVMHELLRGVVKDPPPCVDTTPVSTKAGRTQRAIAMQRIENKNCGGCHAKFEPLAFGLEKFNGLGHFHETDEHGNALRDDGEVLFPGDAKAIPFKNSAELMDLLAGSTRVRESLTWKLTQFALGRPLVAADAAELAKVHRAASEAGGTYRDVMMEIVMSDLVQMKATEEDPADTSSP